MSGWPPWLQAAGTAALSLLLCWVLLVAVLWRARPDALGLRECLTLLPDLLGLVRRLAADRGLPRRVRTSLWLLLGYLLLPVDLVPDVVPVLGLADDAIAVVLVLRFVVRSAGPGALAQHWRGTAAGLDVVLRVAGARPRPARGTGAAAVHHPIGPPRPEPAPEHPSTIDDVVPTPHPAAPRPSRSRRAGRPTS